MSCAWPKGNQHPSCPSAFPIPYGPRAPFRREAWDGASDAFLLHPFSQLSALYLPVLGKEWALTPCPGSAPFTGACLKRQKSLKGQLHQLSWVVTSWRTEGGWCSVLMWNSLSSDLNDVKHGFISRTVWMYWDVLSISCGSFDMENRGIPKTAELILSQV